jgi:hypothetical protein
MTRAERREAREADEAGVASGPGSVAPSAASPAGSAGAAGAATVAERGDDESERIASAADFRDDVPADPAHEEAEVYATQDAGSEQDMDDDSRTDTAPHTSHHDAVNAGDQDGTGPSTESAGDLSQDVESPRGEWGGPHQGEPAAMTIVGEPEAYAATEPLMASDQTPPVTREPVATDDTDDTDDSTADPAVEPAEASTRESTQESTEERHDPSPTRDWAADEGELLEENHDRGERLESERADLAEEGDGAKDDAASDDAASDDATDATDATDVTAPAGRRVSAFDELRDGGFGVGSAAPLADGAQPLDHPVAAYRDTMTYRAPGDPGYESAEPHVWFYDEGAAERSGFTRAES